MEKLLTENEVVAFMIAWLKKDGWRIKNAAFGAQHGNDIEAERADQILIVEAKGAKANDDSKTKKRESFNSTQIKVHFGKALIKVMEEQTKNPSALVAIAQPDTTLIRKTLKDCLPQIKKLNIQLYLVTIDGRILVE